MRQYARPPEGNDYDDGDHGVSAIIFSGCIAFLCIVMGVMIVCVKGCA